MSWLSSLLVLATFGLIGFLTHKLVSYFRIKRAKSQADSIISEAKEKASSSNQDLKSKKKEIDEYREKLTNEIQNLEKTIDEQQTRVESLKERLENRNEIYTKLEKKTDQLHEKCNQTKSELDELLEEKIELLEKKSNAERDNLTDSISDEILSNIKLVAQRMKSNSVEVTESKRDFFAKQILRRIIQRTDITSPESVSSAALKFPDEDAFVQFQEFYEKHTDELIEDINTDIRFEDDPQMAVIETLKPLEKEIAYRTLNNIIQQKKFNYELIESGMNRYTRQVKDEQTRAAQEALKDASLDDIPNELEDLLGILKFRTSYGQQQLVHSIEVAHLGELMANEIGADSRVTKRAGMLHDIGKAIDRQREQGHAVIGAELAEDAGEPDIIVNAIGSHHGDMEAKYVESILVAAADAISGSRPGVRRENVTNYSERIESLRELAQNRKGINKVYAMNAGRELRIRVDNQRISDKKMEEIARSIAKDIEDQLTYSGKIKINTIRETKVTKVAKNSES